MEIIRDIQRRIKLANERRRFPVTLQESGIQKTEQQSTTMIGEERKRVFVANVREEDFLRYVTESNPGKIIYSMVNMGDTFAAAAFYVQLGNHQRSFISTTGFLEDISEANTLLARLEKLGYQITQHHNSYEQRWGMLVLDNTDVSQNLK